MSTPKSRQEPSRRHAVARDTILFEEQEGIYYLRGESLYRMFSILEQPSYADCIGLDFPDFMFHAKQLLEKGVKVGIQKGNVHQNAGQE